jgi:hypothetical protein
VSSIKLCKRVTQKADHTYRLQVWVGESSDNIPSEIFLHRSVPSVDDWEGPSSVYYGICSYADLLNYSIDSPDAASNFFRKAGVDAVFSSASSLEETWDQISTDTEQLVNDIVRTYAATAEDVSYSGTNFSVSATLKHHDADGYSYLLQMTADLAVFVMENESDGQPELVSVASIADMNTYGEVETTTGYYRTNTLTIAFSDETTYERVLAALDVDFAALDAALTSPGVDVEGTSTETISNTEIVGPTVFYFGE